MPKNLRSLKQLAFLSSSLVLLSTTAVSAMDPNLLDQIKNRTMKLKSSAQPHPSQRQLPQVDNSFRNAINQRGASMQGKPPLFQQLQQNPQLFQAMQIASSKSNAQKQNDEDWLDDNTNQASSSTGGAAGKTTSQPAPARSIPSPVDPKLVQQKTPPTVSSFVKSSSVWPALSPLASSPSTTAQLTKPVVSSPQTTFKAPRATAHQPLSLNPQAPSTPSVTSTSPVVQMNQQPDVSVSKVSPTLSPTVEPLESSVELRITRHSSLFKFSLPDKSEVHVNSGNQVWVKTPDQGYPATPWESYASANKFNFRVNVCQGDSDSLELRIPRGAKPFSFLDGSEVAVDHTSTWVKERNGPGFYATPFDKFAQKIGLPNAKAAFADVISASMQVTAPSQPAPALKPVTPTSVTLLPSVINNMTSSSTGHSLQSASSSSSSSSAFVPSVNAFQLSVPNHGVSFPSSFESSHVDPNHALQQAQLQNHLAVQQRKMVLAKQQEQLQPTVKQASQQPSLAVAQLARHLVGRVEHLKKHKILTEDDVTLLKAFPLHEQSWRMYEIVLKKNSTMFFDTFISIRLKTKVEAAYNSGKLSSTKLYELARLEFKEQTAELAKMLQ
jgi:hypothetical protein